MAGKVRGNGVFKISVFLQCSLMDVSKEKCFKWNGMSNVFVKVSLMILSVLTVHPQFSFSRCDAAAVFSRTAVDAHVSRQHGSNDKLLAALLVFVDHVMVVLLQQLAIFIPANSGRGLANYHAVKADRITIGDILTLQLCQEDWGSCTTRANN